MPALVVVGAVPLFVTPQSKYNVSVLYNELSSPHPEPQDGLFTTTLAPEEHPGGGEGVKLGFCWALAVEQKQVRTIGMRTSAKMFLLFLPLVVISTPLLFSFFVYVQLMKCR